MVIPHLQLHDAVESRREAVPGGIAAGWTLLNEAGWTLAGLAGLAPIDPPIDGRDFEQRAAAEEARLALVTQAIDDLAAVLAAGLTAILAAQQSSRDTTAAASALWREFHHAREALLALVSPPA